MFKELLFGKKVRSILVKTDKILKKMAGAPVEDLKDVYKITTDMVVGVSGKIFTPENIEAALKTYLEYRDHSQTEGMGIGFSKKF